MIKEKAPRRKWDASDWLLLLFVIYVCIPETLYFLNEWTKG